MGNKIKILHVIPTLGAGGAERLVNDLIPLFDENIFEVELFVNCTDNAFFIDKLLNGQVKIHSGNSSNIKSFKNFISLYSTIKKGNYDIIHGHLFPTNYWISIISFLFRDPKYFFTEHSTHNRRRNYKFLRPLERIVYGSFDKIISISMMTENNLKKWLRKEEDSRYTVINNGIDIDKFISAKPYKKNELSNELKQTDFILVMVGRFSPQKDQATVIKSLLYLPKDIKLVLVGEGPRKEYLENLTNELGLDNRVLFLGLRKDVAEINKTADVIVVSSNWEGFGLVAVEAMACERPLISSKVPGLTEVTQNYGQLFNKGSEEELAKLVLELYNSENERKKWKNLSKQGAKKYSIDKMCEEYTEIYIKYFDV